MDTSKLRLKLRVVLTVSRFRDHRTYGQWYFQGTYGLCHVGAATNVERVAEESVDETNLYY